MSHTVPEDRDLLRAHALLDDRRPAKTPPGLPDARLDDQLSAIPGVRELVRRSWRRSLLHHCDPDRSRARPAFGAAELHSRRQESPLLPALPVLDRLLVQPATDTGLVVAVGDAFGRLLWVLGDDSARRRAARMGFEAGADWSEESVGTSAPGTALAIGQPVQIRGPEHFSRTVHPWSCTAVPLRDPRTGEQLGVLDLTGDEKAVAGHSMALVRAAAAAAEYALMMEDRRVSLPGAVVPAGLPSTGSYAGVQVTGPHSALIASGRRLELRQRHAEILLLLAEAPDGLSSADLAEALGEPGHPLAEVTLRAEVVRLRKVLDPVGLAVGSRPYRLPSGVEVDAVRAREALTRGDLDAALDDVRGEVLPASRAAGVVALRYELGAQLRHAVLESGTPAQLCRYLDLPAAAEDTEAWRLALKLLPPESPRRPGIVAHLERLQG